MSEAQQALNEIRTHERECALRYERIEDDGRGIWVHGFHGVRAGSGPAAPIELDGL